MSDSQETTLLNGLEVANQVLPGVTPGNLLEAMEDPEMFAEVARADLFIQLGHMRVAASHPDFPTSQRIDYAKFLARMGKVDAPDRSAMDFDRVPGINIIFPSGGGVTIQSAPAEREVGPERIKPGTAVLP